MGRDKGLAKKTSKGATASGAIPPSGSGSPSTRSKRPRVASSGPSADEENIPLASLPRVDRRRFANLVVQQRYHSHFATKKIMVERNVDVVALKDHPAVQWCQKLKFDRLLSGYSPVNQLWVQEFYCNMPDFTRDELPTSISVRVRDIKFKLSRDIIANFLCRDPDFY